MIFFATLGGIVWVSIDDTTAVVAGNGALRYKTDGFYPVPDLQRLVAQGKDGAAKDVAAIKAELLVVLAANDERINAAWPEYEAALKANKVKYQLFQPPGTQHGFHNDTTPRYDEDAARAAWQKTLALFKRTLRKAA